MAGLLGLPLEVRQNDVDPERYQRPDRDVLRIETAELEAYYGLRRH